MTRKNIVLSVVTISALAGLSWIFWAYIIEAPSASTRSKLVKQGPNSLCVLTGDMIDTKKSKQKGFEALGNFVRIRFGATQLKDCTEAIMEYCRTSLNQGFVPGNLGITFRESNDPETKTFKYTFDRNCNLQLK
jgi:hypothetical protein